MAEPIPTNPTSGQLERVNPAVSNAKPASLYVGDLLPSVTESTLFDIFKDIGDVVSIRVCRDANSRQSLGYAYVNFSSRQKADLAIDTYNFHNINGRPCRIMWQLRDPSLRKSGVGNLFIKNLEPTIDQMGLYDTFSTFGSILSCKVALDNHGKSKGYGFVHFSSEEEANKAISSLNGMLLNGKAVTISPFIPRKDRNIKNPEETFTNVYTKDLDESIKTTEDLNRLFEKFGKITSGKLMTDINNVSKGFGFVNFQDHEAAAAAVNNLNGKEIGDGKKSLYVARAQTKDERKKYLEKKREETQKKYQGHNLYVKNIDDSIDSEKLREAFSQTKDERKKYLEKKREETQKKYQGHNLYVKNIDDSIDSEKLREAFSQFGKITSAIVMVNEKGISKGFGFVCFSTTDEANEALAKMNSSMLANKQLYVAMAQPIEHRRAQLSAQHAARPGPMRGHGMPIYQGGMVPYMGYPGPRPFGGAPVRPGPGGVPRGMYPGPQGGQRGMPNQSFGGPGRGKPVGANVNKPPHAQPGRQPEGGDDIADQLISALQDTDAFNTVIGGLLTKRLQTFVEPERLPKVTGMILLEINNSDNPSEKAKFLLGSDQSLNEKVQQCLDILAKESQ